MYFLYILKIISDLAFFFAFINVMAVGLLRVDGTLALISLPVFTAVAMLCLAVYQRCQYKWLRFAPLALMGLVFLWLPLEAATIGYVALPMFYITFSTAILTRFDGTVFYNRVFLYFVRVYLLFILVGVSVGVVRPYFLAYSMPYAVLFFVSSVVLMRMARHEPEVHTRWRFRLMNLASLGLVLVVGVLAGSPRLVGAIWGGIRAVFVYGIWPAVVFAFDQVWRGISFLLSLLPQIEERLPFDDEGMNGEPDYAFADGHELVQDSNVLINFVTLAIAFIAVVIIVMLLKRLLTMEGRKATGKGIHETYLPHGVKPVKAERSRDPIRKIFRRFLRRCHTWGIPEQAWYTSLDYQINATEKTNVSHEIERLRALYLPTRYSGKPPSHEEVAEARELYKVIRKLHPPKT